MKSSKLLVLGLGFILLGKSVYAYNWPFANPNEQVEIAGVFGELRKDEYGNFDHFHRGVDLVKPADTPVYSVISGEVAKTPSQSGQELWIKYIGRNDGYRYVHIKDHTGDDVVPGKEVYPIGHPDCKPIGKVKKVEGMGEHLHFEDVLYKVNEQGTVTGISSWNNPLMGGGLGATTTNMSNWGFKDNVKPEIDSVSFYTQGSEIYLSEKGLYGKVDIAVAAHDARIGVNGNSAGGGLGVKRVTCKIYDLWNPDDDFLNSLLFEDKFVSEIVNYISTNNIPLPEKYESNLVFYSIPKYSSKAIELSKLELTYRSNSTIDRPVYWVTNLPYIDMATYTNFYWDATTRTLTCDGPYLVEIEVEDFRGTTTTTHRFVRVDNNAPYLDTVGAYQMEPFDIKQKSEKQHIKSICLEKIEKEKLAKPEEIKEMYAREQDELIGYQAKYFASWEENQNGRKLNVSLKKPLLRGVESKFLLLFSQPVNIDSAFICPNGNVNNRIQIKLNSQNEEGLNYYISDPVIIPSSTDWDGEVLLIVDAYDVNWNNLDSYPQTIAVRDEYGFHTNYEEGSDRNHFFELPVAPSAPSDFTANVITQNRQPQWINFDWKDNSSDEDGFAIFQRKDGEKNYSLVVELPPNANSTGGILLPEQGVYFYTVRAFKKQTGYSVSAAEQMAAFVPGGEDSDLEPPGGRIIYEKQGVYVKGSVTIKAKVWDNVGVKKVEFYCLSQGEEYFIGESSNFFHTPEGTFTTYEWDSSRLGKLGEGILCYIRDYMNNRSSSENIWSIWTDNIPPTGISNLQTLPIWTNINYFGASWDPAQDYESYVEGYYYSLNSPPKENASFTLNTQTEYLFLPEDSASGVYSIYVTSKDAAGNIGPTSKGLFFYDISPPIITNSQSTPNIIFASKTVKFTARVEDIHSGIQWVIISTSVIGIQNQLMYDDGLLYGDERANDGIYTTQVTIPDDTNVGIYNLVVSAYDSCPNPNIATSTITLQIGNPDYTPPTITNPQSIPPIVLRGGTITFTVNVVDEGSRVGTVTIGLGVIGGNANQQMFDDGTNGDEEANNGIYTYKTTIPESVLIGMKNLIITAQDNVSNISKGTITLQVINPKITSVLPTSGTIGTAVTIKGEGYLANEGIRIDFGTTLTICLTTADTNGSFTATFKADSQGYGLQIITATGLFSKGQATATFKITSSLVSIKGTVRDAITNEKIPGAVIEFIQDNQIKVSVTTNGDGEYRIDRLLQGIYQINAKKEKIYSQWRRVRVGWIFSRRWEWRLITWRVLEYIPHTKFGVVVDGERDIDFYLSKAAWVENAYIYEGNAENTDERKNLDVSIMVNYDPLYWFYLYPKDSSYKIENFSRVPIGENGCIAQIWYDIDWDNGSYIDKENNRLHVKVEIAGYWWQRAYFNYRYTIDCKKKGFLGKSENNMIIGVEPGKKKKLKTKGIVKLMINRIPIQQKGITSGQEENVLSIMIKDVEDTLTTSKIKLRYNSDKINISDIRAPDLPDKRLKVFVGGEVDNDNGSAEIETLIVDEELLIGTYTDIFEESTLKIQQEETATNSEASEKVVEENIAPIAHVIITPRKTKGVRELRLEDMLSCIEILDVELKNAQGEKIQINVEEKPHKPTYESNLDNAYCYPNPTKKGWIKFAKLTQTIKVRIFNIVGELIYEREHPTNGEWEWQCIDNDGKKVASGIYIYILHDPVSGSMKRGKLGVIK